MKNQKKKERKKEKKIFIVSEIEHRRTKSFYRISLIMAAGRVFHKRVDATPNELLPFSTVLEFIFLSVCITRSTRIHIRRTLSLFFTSS